MPTRRSAEPLAKAFSRSSITDLAIEGAGAGFLACSRMLYRLFAVVPQAVPGCRRHMVLRPRTVGGDSFGRFNEPRSHCRAGFGTRRGKINAFGKFSVKPPQASGNTAIALISMR